MKTIGADTTERYLEESPHKSLSFRWAEPNNCGFVTPLGSFRFLTLLKQSNQSALLNELTLVDRNGKSKDVMNTIDTDK